MTVNVDEHFNSRRFVFAFQEEVVSENCHPSLISESHRAPQELPDQRGAWVLSAFSQCLTFFPFSCQHRHLELVLVLCSCK